LYEARSRYGIVSHARVEQGKVFAFEFACKVDGHFVFTFSTFLQLGYHSQHVTPFVEVTYPQTGEADKKQAIYNLFAAYLHTVPLAELLESVERARLDAKLRYVVIYGAACSYCLGRAERLDGSYLRTFALELKEQLAQTLASFVTSILTEPRRRPDTESAGLLM
jgi:hypothetical protein